MQWESCYETPVEAEAHVVKGFLEHYGVPCVLQSDRFRQQPLTFCALGQVRILVPEDWLHVARGLIDGRAQRRRTTRYAPLKTTLRRRHNG
jgi:hypothetical protein